MRARGKFLKAATLVLLTGAAAAAVYTQLVGPPAKTIEPPRRGVSVALAEPTSPRHFDPLPARHTSAGLIA
jgi:hypothetical protein